MAVSPRSLASSLLALFCLLSSVSADTWILANGDRLSGRLITESDATVEIEHPQLGRLVLERGKLRPAPAGSAAVAAQPAPPAVPRTRWKRQVEFGYVMQEGAKSREEISARAQVEARRGANNVRGTARVLRAKSQGLLTLDRTEADLRWRREFNKRLFAQAQTTYASDDVRLIDLSLEQQIGGGYSLLKGERQTMNVGLGVVVQRLAREGFEDETALLGTFFQDYAFALSERLRVAQEASVFVTDDTGLAARGGRSTGSGAPADGNYRVKFNTALQGKMTEQVSLNLRYDYDYDRSLPNPDLRADSRLTTSLGYAW